MIRTFSRIFSAHPQSVGETYMQHAGIALRFGGSMIAGGLACVVHAAVPALFRTSASRRVRQLNAELAQRTAEFERLRERESGGSWQLEYEI